jgi:DNA polymerase III epsilon subunit-like protein
MNTIFFDLETGGVEDHNPNIQLAAIVISDDFVEIDAFEQKISFDPDLCSPEALTINHYDPRAWEKSISSIETAQRFAKWAKPYSTVEMISKRTGQPYFVGRLAGYNALTFDLPRLRSMFGTGFFPFSYHVRDVLQRAMWWFDENPVVEKPKSLKLADVCAFFDIEVNGAHDALVDVRLTAALARRLGRGIAA